MEPDSWWTAIENWGIRTSSVDPSADLPDELKGPVWREDLAEAALVEAGRDVRAARAALDRARLHVPAGAWEQVAGVVDLIVALAERRDPSALLPLARARAQAVPADAPATAARAHHVHAVTASRTGGFQEAEEALVRAVDLAPSPARFAWILDTLGQVLSWQGAWVEARRIFRAAARRKQDLEDHLGRAITTGNLALLEMALGEARAAAELCRDLRISTGDALPPETRLRTATLEAQAWQEAGAPQAAQPAGEVIRALLPEAPANDQRGFAALALARLAGAGAPREARRWLDDAAQSFQTRVFRDLAAYWQERLLGTTGGDLAPPAGAPAREERSEAHVLTCCLRAERVLASGRPADARAWLDRALHVATAENHPFWMAQVDRVYRRLDPEAYAERVIERFTGVGSERLAQTVLEEATVMFTDLVGFTARSGVLSPEEVIQTVRSLFELAVPLLRGFRVRPLQHMGDGLLSIAQGEGHAERGVRFALAYVRRVAGIGRIRRALGEEQGFDVRAGVASGPVVFGLLGTFAKLEHLAIGRTTNLASRLQGLAEPREVVATTRIAADGVDIEAGTATLKGFAEPMPYHRYRWSASPASKRPG